MAEMKSTGTEAAMGGVWKADPFHTQVEFAAKHLGILTVRGHFAELSVDGHLDPDRPKATSVEVTIPTASIRTHNEVRDNDLWWGNFLEFDKYPTITFKSTQIESTGHDGYTITGDLTIKGVTRPVTLKGVRYGEFNDPTMGRRIAYSVQGQINRRDFDMTFSPMLDAKFVVSNEVELMIEGELVAQQQESAASTASA